MHKDLERINIDISNIEEIAQDRKNWKQIVEKCIQKMPNAEEPAKQET